MLLHVLHFVVQCGWYLLLSGFDPLRYQYDAMVRYWEGDLCWRELVECLRQERPWSNVLAVVELAMMVYVWMSLLYPPVRCDLFVPTSFLYYPLMLTLLDCSKLNVYRAMRWWESVWRSQGEETGRRVGVWGRLCGTVEGVAYLLSVDVMVWYLGMLWVQAALWTMHALGVCDPRNMQADRTSTTGMDERPTIEFRESAAKDSDLKDYQPALVTATNPILM